jgi:hypothetical protein
MRIMMELDDRYVDESGIMTELKEAYVESRGETHVAVIEVGDTRVPLRIIGDIQEIQERYHRTARYELIR